MSTRCQIGLYKDIDQPIDKPEILLYKHSDGYPKDVVPIIVPFLKEFINSRRLDDSTYLGAWLIHHLIDKHIKWLIKFYKERKEKPDNVKDFLGHGICKDFHWDIEFFYRIYPNFLEVYKANFDQDAKDFQLVEAIKIKSK